ncbi:UPP1 [Cordylochernes scorpioides]|uniref:UPP1 n=1 Tax=Cordylochernes scorpioides TaxID=51811 RepID=A0ABY6LUB0_9ARAC|nr:UPP1 [Cordylochernes scorpioides]
MCIAKLSWTNNAISSGYKNAKVSGRNAICHVSTLWCVYICHVYIKFYFFTGAVICVTILDRLKGDQVDAAKAILEDYQKRPQKLASLYIKKKLNYEA